MNGVSRRRTASLLVATLLALVWAFFVSFNAVFSDAFGSSAYVQLAFYVLSTFGLLGLVFGLASPATGWRWVFWLTWPTFAVLLWYSFREPGRIGWHLSVLALAFAGSVLGGLAGSGVHARSAASRRRDS